MMPRASAPSLTPYASRDLLSMLWPSVVPESPPKFPPMNGTIYPCADATDGARNTANIPQNVSVDRRKTVLLAAITAAVEPAVTAASHSLSVMS